MPSERILRDNTHCVKSGNGFSTEVDKQLMLAMGELCQDYEKMVVLLIDEMYVKEDTVYNKHTSQLISCFLKISLATSIYRTLAAGCGNLCGSHLGVKLSNKTMASTMQGALLPGYMDTISDVLSKKILHDEVISFVYVAAVITG